jgi:hypothetical protein
MTERIMVEMAVLDQAGKAANRAVVAVQDAQMYHGSNDAMLLVDALSRANSDTQAAYLLLKQMGAHVPEGSQAKPVPLHLLNTPAVRNLIAALVIAREAAEEVDRERGWLAGGQGCGYTDAVNDVLYRVKPEADPVRGTGGE